VEDFVRTVIRSYRRTLTADRRRLLERYRYVHTARKVVGVGSVGTRAWAVLMLGRDDADPLILQLKEAAASDILLGCVRFTAADGVSRDFYMRQLWDGKGSALVELMDPTVMEVYAELCGQALAKAHDRSGDAVAIAGYLGSGESFDRAMASFAELYADQNERDYAAVASGRVAAQTDL
jgi:hypothetical protein